MDKAALARLLDHTCLKPDTAPADIERLCAEARDLGVGAVVVPPAFVPLAVRLLAGSACAVATVVGFPTGREPAAAKCAEAARALDEGAREIDMVAPWERARAGDWATWEADVRAVAAVVHARRGCLLKVIVESAALEDAALDRSAALAAAAGADFVKTSTGFHPAGGATTRAVARITRALQGRTVGIKASGGIRTAAQAREMIAAGATRIGTSAAVAILADWNESIRSP